MRLRLTISFVLVIISGGLRAQSVTLLIRGEKFADTTVPVQVLITAYKWQVSKPTIWRDTLSANVQPFQKRKFEKRVTVDTFFGKIVTTTKYYFNGSKVWEKSLGELDTGELNYVSFQVGSHRQPPIDTVDQLWLTVLIDNDVLHNDHFDMGSSSYPYEEFAGHKHYISRLALNGFWDNPDSPFEKRDDEKGVSIQLQDFLRTRMLFQQQVH